jgi:hypothetical protein
MTTTVPKDAAGHELHPAQPGNKWVEWSARVNQRIAAQRTTVANLAEALKQQLVKERAERAREVGSLRQELAMLKAELATARKLDELVARLDKIEGSSPSRGATLRAVMT